MGVTSSGSRVQGASSLLIAQLARGTRRQMEQAIAPTGLRPTELLVLQHLRERGPSAQQTLTELIGIDATNLVAVLNSLEDGGLIDRRRDRADRRRAIIALSPPGELLLADLDRSLAFFRDRLGLEVVSIREIRAEYFGAIVGLPGMVGGCFGFSMNERM